MSTLDNLRVVIEYRLQNRLYSVGILSVLREMGVDKTPEDVERAIHALMRRNEPNG
jgi:hypothetical protein